ncbi:MAG: hypothetical protein M3N17_08375, partial [Actinomycetota bacterium]|nr:hypothetical protein [Actinomycetota bacterium]
PRALLARLGDEPGPACGLYLPGGAAGLLHPPARGPGPDGRPLLDVDVVAAVLSETAPHAPVEHVTEPVEAVEADPGAALFVVRPVPADRVFALGAAGHRLPPKTTWFRPKPRTGLVMRAVAEPATVIS